MGMRRISHAQTVIIANGAALSSVVDMSGSAGGLIDIPAAWTAADLGFHHCSTRDGTFQPLYDDEGTLIEVDLPTDPTDQSFSLPAKLFPAQFVKLWSETGGSGQNQGAARSIILNLKT